jgi:hypothetical protein
MIFIDDATVVGRRRGNAKHLTAGTNCFVGARDWRLGLGARWYRRGCKGTVRISHQSRDRNTSGEMKKEIINFK